MSANNYILIKQYEKEPYFRVTDEDADSTERKTNYIGVSETLDLAARIAQKYDEESLNLGFPVEYGIKLELLND